MPTKLTNEVIAAAIEGFQAQKHHLDAQIAELRAMLSGGSDETAATPELTTRKRRTISAAGRRAIAEAQRKRWAEKKQSKPTTTEESPKPKRKLSAAGRKAIIAATKKRWALKRAEAAKA
jgi:cell division septum initiation protein DivIVA